MAGAGETEESQPSLYCFPRNRFILPNTRPRALADGSSFSRAAFIFACLTRKKVFFSCAYTHKKKVLPPMPRPRRRFFHSSSPFTRQSWDNFYEMGCWPRGQNE